MNVTDAQRANTRELCTSGMIDRLSFPDAVQRISGDAFESLATGPVLVFTHNDLDAFGCVAHIENALPGVQKQYFYTNYGNIPEIVYNISTCIMSAPTATPITDLVIADVSFSDNVVQLRKLYDLCLGMSPKINITLLDHHLYPDGFADEFPEMTVRHCVGLSATVITGRYLGTQTGARLTAFEYLTDVYDIWRTENPAFGQAQDLNTYFWDYVRRDGNDILSLVSSVRARGWRLPDDFTDTVNAIRAEQRATIDDLESRGLIKRAVLKCTGPGARSLTLILSDTCFNEIMISEMSGGVDVVVGITSYGIVRVRIRAGCTLPDASKNALRLALTGTENIGHMNAFTYKISSATFARVIDEAKKVTAELSALQSNE